MSVFNFPAAGGFLPMGGYAYPPTGGDSDYGLLHDFYLIGGYQVLPTIQDRNDIPIITPNEYIPYDPTFIDPTGFGSGRRKIGMIVYVQETDETYRLIPKGYFGNGGTGATGDSDAWLALPPWEKAILLDPTAQGVKSNVEIGGPPYSPPYFLPTYTTVNGSGNPDDCWVKVSTETDVTYAEAYEITPGVYGGTGSKEILAYDKDVSYLIKFQTTNTGPSTISIDGFEQTSIKKQTPFGLSDLSAGDIKTDLVYSCFYDGTYFQIPIPSSTLAIYGPSGDLLAAGATGIQFTGTGVSASANNGFVTIDITGGSGGSGGGSPVGVYGTAGNLLTAGLTGIQFIGTGVSSGASGDYVTVEIGQYTYPSDLTVSIQPGKTFGRYENGDIIPAAGKTPAEVIVLAINEAIDPTVNLSATPATIPFYTASQNIAVSFSYTINTLGGTVASVLLRRRRGNGAWTTLTTDTGLTSYTDTITNSPASDTTNVQYEYTVTDDQGATTTATDTVTFIPYVAPTIAISVTAANTPLASPETNSSREIGNISSNITGTVTINSANATLQSYQIQYQKDGAGSFTTIDSGAISSSPFTVPSFNHNDVALDDATSLTYKIVVTDVYATNSSANSSVNFNYLIFNGPSATIPVSSANVRALSRVFVTSPPFNLLTGTTFNKFTVAMPATNSLVLVIDLDATNANLTNEYIAGLNTFNVNDYAGNPVSYKVYTMTSAIPYSDTSHRHNITFN